MGLQTPQVTYPGGQQNLQSMPAQQGTADPAIVGYMPTPTITAESQQTTRDQILQTFQQLGFDVGRVSQTRYRTPYPKWIDQAYPYPRGYRVPEFTLFSGENNASTVEHVARFTTQCGEAAVNSYLKMRLFANSLTQTAFHWYVSLPLNSVHTWNQMEQAFHGQFYKCEPEVTLADLASVRQGLTEPVERYMARFKTMRNKCRVAIPEKECVHLLLMGMTFNLRKKLYAQTFLDVSHLQAQAVRIEANRREEDRRKTASQGTHHRDQAATSADTASQSSDSSREDDRVNVAVAEIVLEKPFVCPALTRAKEDKSRLRRRDNERSFEDRRKYSFDITKAEEIFNLMLKEKLIALKGEHAIPPKEEREGKKYCKWHNSWSHDTSNCIVLRDNIEKAVANGLLKFPERKIQIDGDPYLRMEVRVADAKRTTGLRAEGSRPNRARPPTPASEEASQTPGIVIRTCPNCYEDYPDEDPDAEWRAWMRVLERDGAVHKREVRRLTKMDGTEQTFVFVKFSEPSAPRTFKPKPNPDGMWTRFEPEKTPARERPQQRETTIHDRLGPKVTARAGKTRSVCPEGLTKTQKRRWQRRHSQAKRVREEAPPAAKKPQIQIKRVWRPKAVPTARADEQPPKEPPKETLDVRADLGGTSMTVKLVLDKGNGPAAPEDEPENEPGTLDQLEGDDDAFYPNEGADADYMQEDSLYDVGDGRA